jgi:hypothetical protein
MRAPWQAPAFRNDPLNVVVVVGRYGVARNGPPDLGLRRGGAVHYN